MAICILRLHGRVSSCLRAVFLALVLGATANAGQPAAAQDAKGATTTTLVSSANPAIQGQSLTFTAWVKADNGIPTGAVTFRDGDRFLGAVPLASNGSAKLAISTLATGPHNVTASYEGDGRFSPSVSPAYEQALKSMDDKKQALAIQLTTILLAALLVVFGGPVSSFAARFLGWVTKPIRSVASLGADVLRSLRLVSRRPSKHTRDDDLGADMQSLPRLLTETDAAIAANFDTSSVRIERHRRSVCSWLHPEWSTDGEYGKERAEADFIKAKRFFGTDVPSEANALNLYDDVHNAFVVELMKDSDKVCFYTLTEFRKAINANVTMLAVVLSLIVSATAVLNIIWSQSLDFYKLAGVPQGRWLPEVIDVLGMHFQTQAAVNTAIFGAASCALGVFLMWMFYHMAYDQSQRHNGLQLKAFLVAYLADINIRFRAIHARATRAVVEDEAVGEMKQDAVLWLTNLQWMAFRAFFIEEFLRGVLFQARRNSIFALFLIPPVFIVAMLLSAWVTNLQEFDIFNASSPVYQQSTFYVFFAWLIYRYYRYMAHSYAPVRESLDGGWTKFAQLKLQGAMTEILESYVNQLDQWRTRFRERNNPMN